MAEIKKDADTTAAEATTQQTEIPSDQPAFSDTDAGHVETRGDAEIGRGAADADDPDTAEPVSESPQATVQDGDDFATQLVAANTRADENWERLLRIQAEMDNLRKRHGREIENAHKFALDKIAAELLGVRDSLENGIKAGQADDADVAKLQEGFFTALRR